MQEQDLNMFEQSKSSNEFHSTINTNKNSNAMKNPIFINSLEKQLAENKTGFHQFPAQNDSGQKETFRNMNSEKKQKYVHYEDPIEHRCNTLEINNTENISMYN